MHRRRGEAASDEPLSDAENWAISGHLLMLHPRSVRIDAYLLVPYLRRTYGQGTIFNGGCKEGGGWPSAWFPQGRKGSSLDHPMLRTRGPSARRPVRLGIRAFGCLGLTVLMFALYTGSAYAV